MSAATEAALQKRCTKCGELKPREAFSRCARNRNGLRADCKVCAAEAGKAWYAENQERKKETSRTWHAANQERTKETTKEWYEANKAHVTEKHKAWKEANKQYLVEYHKAYRIANKEREAEAKKVYRAANRERRAAYSKAWVASNPERAAETQRAWKESNPDKRKAQGHRRRARELGASGTYTPAELDAIRAAQTDKRGRLICWRCGKPLKGTPHLDHWIPLSRGGSNKSGNLHYMHARCNISKGAKMPTELGRLL